jgi:hypothetical protein
LRRSGRSVGEVDSRKSYFSKSFSTGCLPADGSSRLENFTSFSKLAAPATKRFGCGKFTSVEIQSASAGLPLTFHQKELFREGPVGQAYPLEPQKVVLKFFPRGAASLTTRFKALGGARLWLSAQKNCSEQALEVRPVP